MQIVVNKDRSIAAVEPAEIYQGSSNADFLSIFAPFSVNNYSSVVVCFELPNGEDLTPRVAFATENMPNGIGVWSMALDARLTEYAGEVKCQLAFVGSTENGETIEKRTDIFSITVSPGIRPELPETPTDVIYQDILSYLSSLSSGQETSGGGTSVVVTQTTGSSKTAVMSQKATTDELTELQANIDTEAEARESADAALRSEIANESRLRSEANDYIRALAISEVELSDNQLLFRNINSTIIDRVTLPSSSSSGSGGSQGPQIEYLEDPDDYLVYLKSSDTTVVQLVVDMFYDPCSEWEMNNGLVVVRPPVANSGLFTGFEVYVASHAGINAYPTTACIQNPGQGDELWIQFSAKSIVTVFIDTSAKCITVISNMRTYDEY